MINEQLQSRIAAKVRNKQNWLLWSNKGTDPLQSTVGIDKLGRPSVRPLTTANYRSTFNYQQLNKASSSHAQNVMVAD